MAEIKIFVPDDVELDLQALQEKYQSQAMQDVEKAYREQHQKAIGEAVQLLTDSLLETGVDLDGYRLTIHFNGQAGPEWTLRRTTNGTRKGRKRIRFLAGLDCPLVGQVFDTSQDMRAALVEFCPQLDSASAKKWPTKAFQRLGIRYEWTD